jgi:hypothetical protein
MVVKAGATESLDLYVELAGATNGVDYQFASKSIDSSAANVTGSFTTPVLRTTDYAVATFTGSIAGTSSQYKASADKVELGAFRIDFTKGANTTSTVDVKLQSVTLYQSGSAALTNLGDITLERNGAVVSTSATVAGKALTFVVGDVIKDGVSATYYIKAKVNNVELTTDNYQFRLKNTSDINVIETATAFRAVTAATPTLNLYTVSGGDVKFERNVSTNLSANYAPGSTNVVLMEGTITAKNAVRLEDINLGIAASTSGNLSSYFNTLYLTVGSSVFSATATGAAGGTVNFNGIVTISGTVPVKLYANLKSNSPAGVVKFNDLKLALTN